MVGRSLYACSGCGRTITVRGRCSTCGPEPVATEPTEPKHRGASLRSCGQCGATRRNREACPKCGWRPRREKSTQELGYTAGDFVRNKKIAMAGAVVCAICGKPPTDENCPTYGHLVCDHIIPTSRGGSHDLGNLQAACERCNGTKGGSYVG